jgi:hypothetical protein
MSDEEHKALEGNHGDSNNKPELEESPLQDTEHAGAAVNPQSNTAQPEALSPTNEQQKPLQDHSDTEIDESNAEDAEDSENERRHQIPFLEYQSLSVENLVGEFQRLLRNEKVQAIKRHVDAIKQEFDQKFQEFLEQKKEEFLERGGEESEFQYNSVAKREFNELYSEYREKRNEYYKTLEERLHTNLQDRLDIIEAIKGLVNMEEDMNSTYKNFKDLQERWRAAGPIPRSNYNDVWRNYQHHVEIFYDFLHLNRELRDLDFRHNLEEKEKLVSKAEALGQEPDLNKAFRELQLLHKIWKEEIGPVARELRDEIWERFSNATKVLHQRRQDHLHELDKRYEGNLALKIELITRIQAIAAEVANNHKELQSQIHEVEKLRDQFFKTGKVPQKDNETVWNTFKGATRQFNRAKNAFYRNLKRDQQDNLTKKQALLDRAKALQASVDWDVATPEFKRIQQEWKEIGHVPHKFSDKIWKQFKNCCNTYFERYNANRSKTQNQENKIFVKATALLDQLKQFKLSGNRDSDFQIIQAFYTDWSEISEALPHHKMHLNTRFQKIIDALMRKSGINKEKAEMMRYEDRIQELEGAEDNRAIEQERQIIRKKIDEVKSEIIQLENNLLFFSNQSSQNPLYQEVVANLEKRQAALEDWQDKLKTLNIMRNSLRREESTESEAQEE